jgi:N-acetylmuramoyl-L-alanine amidase
MLKRPFTVTAGHSDKDPGAVYFGFSEEELMQELRDLVALKLQDKGHQVITDGARGTNESLLKAIRLILGSAVAIELHTNAATNPTASGVEVVALPKDKALAQALAQSIANTLGLRVRGDGGWIDQSSTQRGRLGFVANGGLVIETFFLSNARDLAVYQTKKWLVAQAIADVLDTF